MVLIQHPSGQFVHSYHAATRSIVRTMLAERALAFDTVEKATKWAARHSARIPDLPSWQLVMAAGSVA